MPVLTKETQRSVKETLPRALRGSAAAAFLVFGGAVGEGARAESTGSGAAVTKSKAGNAGFWCRSKGLLFTVRSTA